MAGSACCFVLSTSYKEDIGITVVSRKQRVKVTSRKSAFQSDTGIQVQARDIGHHVPL